jgi:hypothetical protein
MAVDTNTRWDGIIVRMRSADESISYPTIVLEALNKIYSKPVGKALLDQIVAGVAKKQFGFTVCIMRPGKMEVVDHKWQGGSIAKRGNEANACNGVGSITSVTWHCNMMSTPDGERPPYIALAHELIHALYNLKGEAFSDASHEEYRTVGLAPVADAREITENKIRAEHDIPLRTAYSGLPVPA